MEFEERYREQIAYAERWTSGFLELKGYKASITLKADYIHELLMDLKPGQKYYQKCLIIPLPTDFELGPGINKHINCLMIIEESVNTKGIKKKWRLDRVFRTPGTVTAKQAILKGKLRPKNIVWVSKEKLIKITKRSIFIDKKFIDPLYDKIGTENTKTNK